MDKTNDYKLSRAEIEKIERLLEEGRRVELVSSRNGIVIYKLQKIKIENNEPYSK